jgi:hypothetical protein
MICYIMYHKVQHGRLSGSSNRKYTIFSEEHGFRDETHNNIPTQGVGVELAATGRE